MVGSDVFAGFEIGNGSGDLDDPVVGAGGKAELPNGLVQERLAGLVDPAEFFEVLGLELGIRVDSLAGKPLELDVSCPAHSHADRFRLFRFGVGVELFVFYGGHFDVEIDSVQDGAGDSSAIFSDLVWRAGAGACGIARIAARAFLRCHSVI